CVFFSQAAGGLRERNVTGVQTCALPIYSGVDSSHGTIVMDETMEYSPIEVDTEVLTLINTSNHSTAQVGKVFGIPRHKFGLETANMNISEMNMDYLVNTLSPYLE